ncbi:MAG TPA: hypothetical protein DD435_08980 [Cyanobacteria bacterium UBA8530]|nr:hypothetical protein [Cyanobacteria bacterium UBA8530]
MRVLYGNGTMAFSYNFTGPVTLAGGRTVVSSRGKGLSFEFMEGLPGGSEQTAVEDFYGRLENFLPRRYQARSFTFDPVPLIFAVLKDAYTIIAFNDKTNTSTASPVFSFEEEEGMGLLARCGDL